MTEHLTAYVAIGSNLGSRVALVRAATDVLRARHSDLVASNLVLTPALTPPGIDQERPAYVNAVVRFECAIPPLALLQQLHGIEAHFGRRRTTRWADRTLDLDVVACVQDGRMVKRANGITLPHPAYRERAFVLHPLLEVHQEAPGFERELLEQSTRTLAAPTRIEAPTVEREQTPAIGQPDRRSETDALMDRTTAYRVDGALDRFDAIAALGAYFASRRVNDEHSGKQNAKPSGPKGLHAWTEGTFDSVPLCRCVLLGAGRALMIEPEGARFITGASELEAGSGEGPRKDLSSFRFVIDRQLDQG